MLELVIRSDSDVFNLLSRIPTTKFSFPYKDW